MESASCEWLLRYDVVLEQKDKEEDAIIMEFKVFNSQKEDTLEATVQSALNQLEEKNMKQICLQEALEKNR